MDASDSKVTTDWFYRLLVVVVFLVGVWLLAMPWTPAIARCTMKRFHLQTNSFAAWAIQQPIPPMYSFANRTEVRSGPPVVADRWPAEHSLELTGQDQREPSSPSDQEFSEVVASRMINHFPTREFTFANARVRYLRDRRSMWFVLRSSYRGQEIRSVYRLDPCDDEGWTATLIESDKTAAGNDS